MRLAQRVLQALNRIGGERLEKLPILSAPDMYGYRNKAQYPVAADGSVETVTVDMGEPILRGTDTPTIFDLPTVVSQPIVVSGKTVLTTCVSMGNPHSVVYVDDVDSLDLEKIGPSYESHPAFPHKTNTEFVEIISRNEVKMRVWERGAGETMACGTGACAVAVASVLNGFTDRDVCVKLRGGDLQIKWDDDDNHVYMTGPATTVYEGDVEI